MTVGQIVDYCIEWNNLNEDNDDKKKKKRTRKKIRKATQADWDLFLG